MTISNKSRTIFVPPPQGNIRYLPHLIPDDYYWVLLELAVWLCPRIGLLVADGCEARGSVVSIV